MARRRARVSEDRGLPPPPFALASAASDPHQVWCLDVHKWDGRHVQVGPLCKLEPYLPGDFYGGAPAPGGIEPGVQYFLFPLLTTADRVRYERYARWGKTKIGWERPG